MENAAEALKIAFAVLLFVMALTLTISSFSQAKIAIDAIITIRDRESQYTYVEPSEGLSRTVGIETVVSSLYKIEELSLEIHFYDKNLNNELNVYKHPTLGEINYLDISTEGIGLGAGNEANEFINALLGGEKSDMYKEYEKYILHKEGLYNKFKGKEFIELLGEYEIGTEASKQTKRVITYILQ